MAVGNNTDLEKRLWEAADQFRANSRLRSSEYSVPVLGLIFLRYADHKFAAVQSEMQTLSADSRREIGAADYQARGVLYLPGASSLKPQAASLMDASGRRVIQLHAGANAVRALAPGVYFIREGLGSWGEGLGKTQKVVVTR